MSARMIAAAALVITSGCASLGTPAGSDTVGTNYLATGGAYRPGGQLIVAVSVQEIGGLTGVCGAYGGRGQSSTTRFLNREVLSAARVSLGDDTLIQNLTFFAEAPADARLIGRTAACRTVDRPWRPEDASRPVTVQIPGRVFGGGGSGADDSEPRIRFRQTPIDASLL